MSRFGVRLLLMVTLAMASPMSEAQHGAKIHMHADSGYAADGLLFEPFGTGPFAALLVIHDEWGLTDSVIAQATRFANAGFVVVAIDLYHGEVAPDAARAAQLFAGVSAESETHDLNASIKFLVTQPNVQSRAIGVVGWSTGAAAALHLAEKDRQISAVVMNTCQPPPGVTFKGGHTSILANIGGCHSAVPPAAVKRFEKQATASDVTLSTTVYPANRETADRPAQKESDASNAEARTIAFLKSAFSNTSQLH